MAQDNLYLFKQALTDGVSAKGDAMAASCDDDIKISAASVQYLALKLNTLVDDAAQLYLSDEAIPEELADALGTMWEMCSDFIAMYENCSRE